MTERGNGMKVNVGGGSLEVLKGDITAQEVEAVVNAANNHLWMGAGVAGAIKKKGGHEIENEAVKQGPIEVGGAVITTGGSLPAQYIIHAAGMGQDLRTDAEKVRLSTQSSLRLAEEKQLRSLAFPAIGTGVGGLPMNVCANVMLKETIAFLTESRWLRTIRFVLYDNNGFQTFEKELRRIFSVEH